MTTQQTPAPVVERLRKAAEMLLWFQDHEHAEVSDAHEAWEELREALATPPTDTMERKEAGVEREAIARIVDPAAWKNYDYWKSDEGCPDQRSRVEWDRRAEKATAPSLAKADLILALAPPSAVTQAVGVPWVVSTKDCHDPNDIPIVHHYPAHMDMVLVPREPTKAMCVSPWDHEITVDGRVIEPAEARRVYRAMIAAAEAPKSGEGL